MNRSQRRRKSVLMVAQNRKIHKAWVLARKKAGKTYSMAEYLAEVRTLVAEGNSVVAPNQYGEPTLYKMDPLP